MPEFLGFRPTLEGSEAVPIRPLISNQLFRLNHKVEIAVLCRDVNLGSGFGELLGFLLHPLRQRFFLGDALFGGVLADVFADFH